MVYGAFLRQVGRVGLSMLILAGVAGCPVVSNLPAPGRELTRQDPEYGQDYLLYVPARYHENQDWPLVIACHGTPPWDTPQGQLDQWKGLAEEQGFLIAAPKLTGTRGDFVPSVEEQVRRQQVDEKTILAVVRAIRAGYQVDESRVFLTGWSAGGYAVLYTGLRHPEVFRALSVSQGNFDVAFVESCVPFIDRRQPIQIMYGRSDLLKDQAQACIDWLRSLDIEPTILERPGAHRRDPMPVFTFFTEVVRHKPWIRLEVADDPTDPMRVDLRIRTSFEPVRYLWDFGDGQPRVKDAAPSHIFTRPGLFTVRVALWPEKGGPYVRQVQLQIPRVRVGMTLPASAPAP